VAKSADAPRSADGLGAIEKGKPVAPKPADTKASEPVKPSDASKEPPKVEASKVDPPKTEPGKGDASKNDPGKGNLGNGEVPKADTKDAPRTATFTSGPQGTPRPAASTTDGPIIDLKAKRLPDPAPAQKTSATGAGIMPGVATKPGDGKSADSKSEETKYAGLASVDSKSAVGGLTGDAAKSAAGSGGTTPKIAPTPPASAARGPGFGSVATAGLLGGVIGAGLLFAVERAGVLGHPDDGRLAALDERIAALAPKDEVARLSQRVASNESALKAVPDAVSTAREALQKASAAPAPNSDGSVSQAAVLPPDIVTRLDSLDQRLSALQEEPGRDQGGEARMAVNPGNGDAAQVTALAERLKTVESQIAAAPKPTEQPDLAPKLAAIETAAENRAKANAEATQNLGQKLTEVQQAVEAKVQAATQASQQAAEAGKTQAAEAAKGIERQVQTQIQAQSDRIAGLDKALSERAEVTTVQAALRVVAADRIVTALNTGSPYADALSALRNYEPGDPARLTAVAVFAERGAPTSRALAAEFRPVADKIAAARRASQVRSVAETGDFSQKLMSMAESIVQVRKVETPAPSAQGAAPAADPVPKVQDALDRGAIAEAAQAFAALPEDIRSQAGEFGTKLKSRAAAGEAAQALLSEAFKGLPSAGASR
jgi:hypothetical protein